MRSSATATASGKATLDFSISAPVSAPASIATTAAALRVVPLPEPWAKMDSATSPVRVIVNTVVVRSGTAMRRTVALHSIANASTAITEYAEAAPTRIPLAARRGERDAGRLDCKRRREMDRTPPRKP